VSKDSAGIMPQRLLALPSRLTQVKAAPQGPT